MPTPAPRALILAALLALPLRPALAQVPPDTVHIVINSGLFTGVNARDAEAAIAVWAQVLSKEIPLDFVLCFALVPDLEGCLQAIGSGAADVVGLSAVDFIAHRAQVQADPMMVGLWGEPGRATEDYVLLVRTAESGAVLADLAGCTVVIGTVDDGTTAAMWLDVLLAREGLPGAADLLAVRSTDRPSDALIRVLFERADACIVTRRTFETMAELNPQVSRDLRPLATSQGYLPQLACYRRGADPEVRDTLIRAAGALTESTQGRQILNLFRCDRPAPFAAHHLAATEALVAEYRRLGRLPTPAANP